ncbi:MAG: substrate-binding domain-containing protein [Treponema sp.]|nr:substrate-binding domain-containing protein [Treponema sp.]MCL2271771.1 substrate-binding domain-containing protein [Treponema sp.]
MKKFLVVLLMLLVASAVFAGGSREALIKVGIVNLHPSESGYREANVKDMDKVFTSANGYQAFKANYNTLNEQLDAARQFINDGVDYLLISAADANGWDSVLADAKRAGIPVFLFDRMINTAPENFTAAVISDMQNQGRNAVAWMEAQNRSGGYRILHIQGQIGSAAQIGRTQPLDAAIARHANWSLVRRGTGGDTWSADEAKRIVSAAIAARENFNIIYAENDGMAEGAMRALQEAGRSHGVNGDVWIMGFDFNKFALRYVMSGAWNFNGQCSPFQADVIDGYIKTLRAGRPLHISSTNWQAFGRTYNNVFVNPEIVIDNARINQAFINQYGLGD